MTFLPWDYGIRNLGRSKWRLGLSVGSAMLSTLLVLCAAGFVRGMERALTSASDPLHVVFMAQGSEESIERSEIPPETATAAATVAGVRQSGGQPLVSPEVYVQGVFWPLAESRPGRESRAVFRGVAPAAYALRQPLRITEGRAPEPGRGELMAGARAATVSGLPESDFGLGRRLRYAGRDWTVVGRFDSPGTLYAGELWAPVEDMLIATRRSTLSSVTLAMAGAEGVPQAELFARRRANDLEITAIPEDRYYAKLSQFFAPVRLMVWAAAVLMVSGGFFGSLNTLYAAFAARIRELGTLQALGFQRLAIGVSLVQESLVAAAAGGLLACGLGLLLLDGLAVNFSGGAFALRLDAPAVAIGLASALVQGFLGALLPALRCLRPDIPGALRSA